MDQNLIILACSFFLSNIIGAIAGFGSVMIGMAFSSLWLPIDSIPPIIMPIDTLTYSYIFLKSRKYLDREMLFKIILPLSLLGIIIGVIVAPIIPVATLKTSFGAFVLYFGVTEVLKEFFAKQKAPTPPTKLQTWLFLVSGGVLQGIFGSGGVMIVSYVSRRVSDKRAFRAILSALWVLLNTVLLMNYLATNRFSAATLKTSAFLLPAVICGVFTGDLIHKRISQKAFRRLVYAILCVAGISLIFH